MNALTFSIHALQPLLVTQPGAGEENSSTAFNFIPGSVVRGAVIERYLRSQANAVTDAAQDPTCRRLFFDGQVCYLNAYPLNRLQERTLPRPLSWRVSKDKVGDASASIYDFAVEVARNLENPKQPKGIFCWRDEEGIVELSTPGHYIGLHNASKDRLVKRKKTSTVYRYQAIPAGERLGAVILAERIEDIEMISPLLEGAQLSLGGSRSAGYGLVRFENIKIEEDWREYQSDEPAEDEVVILTLLSNAILRDANGQVTTDPRVILGDKPQSVYQKTIIAGGFNRKWGLPLPQSLALEAGSVFVYPADQVDEQTLEVLEREGIGERRAEGFGRVAINWHTQAKLAQRPSEERSVSSTIALSTESRDLAERMAGRWLRAVLDQKLIDMVNRLDIANPPQNAQISWLRLAVRRAWRKGDPEIITQHLDNLKAARQQFEQARIENKQLLSWFIDGIRKDRIWSDYLEPEKNPRVAGVVAAANPEIKLEYTARLLDALLKKALKMQAEKEGA